MYNSSPPRSDALLRLPGGSIAAVILRRTRERSSIFSLEPQFSPTNGHCCCRRCCRCHRCCRCRRYRRCRHGHCRHCWHIRRHHSPLSPPPQPLSPPQRWSLGETRRQPPRAAALPAVHPIRIEGAIVPADMDNSTVWRWRSPSIATLTSCLALTVVDGGFRAATSGVHHDEWISHGLSPHDGRKL